MAGRGTGDRGRRGRRGRDRIAELRSEEGWSGWTASYRRVSRPTSYTWSGLREIMGAAVWVAGWFLGIVSVAGVAVWVLVTILG
jgi:hypothetical protein